MGKKLALIIYLFILLTLTFSYINTSIAQDYLVPNEKSLSKSVKVPYFFEVSIDEDKNITLKVNPNRYHIRGSVKILGVNTGYRKFYEIPQGTKISASMSAPYAKIQTAIFTDKNEWLVFNFKYDAKQITGTEDGANTALKPKLIFISLHARERNEHLWSKAQIFNAGNFSFRKNFFETFPYFIIENTRIRLPNATEINEYVYKR